MKSLPIQYLSECFVLMQNGDLFWKSRPREHFKSSRACSVWNARFPGRKCGCLDGRGYLVTGLNSTLWSNHRIVFAMVNGWWPEEVDHFDQNPLNNTPSNLRAADRTKNAQNNKMRRDNYTGITGVDKLPNGSFRARITSGNKTTTIGCFKSLNEAASARAKAALRLGFSPNHGSSR